MSSATVSDFDW